MYISDIFHKLKFSLVAGAFVAAIITPTVVYAQNTNVQATVCAIGAISGVVLVANSPDTQSLQISGSVTQAPYVDVFVDGQKRTHILISGSESDFFTTVVISPGAHVVQAYIYDACTQQDLVSEVSVTVSGGEGMRIVPLHKPESFTVTKNMQHGVGVDNYTSRDVHSPLSVVFLRDIFTMHDEKGRSLWQYAVLFFAGIIFILYALYLLFSHRLWRPINYNKGKNKKAAFKRRRAKALLAGFFGGVLILVSLAILV